MQEKKMAISQDYFTRIKIRPIYSSLLLIGNWKQEIRRGLSFI